MPKPKKTRPENFVYSVRKALCLTQQELACATGLTRQYLCDLERDKHPISTALTQQLCLLLAEKFFELLKHVHDKPNKEDV